MSIPNPTDAARLRRQYADNPLIQRAVDYVRYHHPSTPEAAASALSHWTAFDQLTDRERAGIVAHFVEPAKTFPWDGPSQAVLDAAAALDPADNSTHARYLREVAQSVLEHRDAPRDDDHGWISGPMGGGE